MNSSRIRKASSSRYFFQSPKLTPYPLFLLFINPLLVCSPFLSLIPLPLLCSSLIFSTPYYFSPPITPTPFLFFLFVFLIFCFCFSTQDSSIKTALFLRLFAFLPECLHHTFWSHESITSRLILLPPPPLSSLASLIMASQGTGYDLSASTYSPDGRIFQIEYAQKAVEASSTVLAIKCKDGIVLAVEKLISSKLLVNGDDSSTNRKIFTVDSHIGLATAGLVADGRHLANRAREEASSFKDTYRFDAPVKVSAIQ